MLKYIQLVTSVVDTWNAEDPSRPIGMQFRGSDDFLRGRFEEYICSGLSALKFADFVAKGQANSVLISQSDMPTGLGSYNESWIAAFKQTPAFRLWDSSTDPVIFDLVEPKHPCEGATSVVQDVGLRLSQGVRELHLEENLAPAREAIGKGLQTGGQGIWNIYTGVKSDLARRQADYAKRKEEEAKLAKEKELSSPTSPTKTPQLPLLSTQGKLKHFSVRLLFNLRNAVQFYRVSQKLKPKQRR